MRRENFQFPRNFQTITNVQFLLSWNFQFIIFLSDSIQRKKSLAAEIILELKTNPSNMYLFLLKTMKKY